MFRKMIIEQIIKAICDSTNLVLVSIADDEITFNSNDSVFLDFSITKYVLDSKSMDYKRMQISGFVYNKGIKLISCKTI